MKRLGLLLILLLIVRITNAQMDANNEGFQTKPEHEENLEGRSMKSDLTNPADDTANVKKTIISSASRKSSLASYANNKKETSIEKKAINDTLKSAQARRPSAAGKPPRMAILLIPPAAVRKPIRISMPNRRVFPSIGKF